MSHWKAKGPKPIVRFCWVCSRQLYGRQFATISRDGHEHVCHKACAQGFPPPYKTEHDFYLDNEP